MAQRYTKEVLDILRAADRSMTTSEIRARIPVEENEKYRHYSGIGAAVSQLYRYGALDREPVSGAGNTYAYSIAAGPRVKVGYTWQDERGPICVMAVADGYAMCRRPGCIPFVIALREVQP